MKAPVSADAAGRRAETVAALTLRFLGWSILARRFTSGRGTGVGEVDLIVARGPYLVFAEVKARPTVGAALEAITLEQRRRIERGAQAWLALHPEYADRQVRFDVIAVPSFGRPHHLADAWRPGD